MPSEFDDELARMDELEQERDHEVSEAVSLSDPLSALDLGSPIVISEESTVGEVITQLQKRSQGCVLVENNGKLSGILTERDILLKITGKGLDLEKEQVGNFMTRSPESLMINDPVAYALNKMYVGGFRHVPLVDKQGAIVGLVSLIDIVRHISTYFSQEILNLPSKLHQSFKRPEGG